MTHNIIPYKESQNIILDDNSTLLMFVRMNS